MSGNERLDSKAGPLGNLSQAYFGGIDTMVKGCEPALKGVGRWNLELFGLMTRALAGVARDAGAARPLQDAGRGLQRADAVLADGGGGLRRRLAAAGSGLGRLRRHAEAQRRRSPATTSRSPSPRTPRLPTSAASARRPEASVVQFVRSTGWLRTRPAAGSARRPAAAAPPRRRPAWRVAATATPCMRACSLRSPSRTLQQRHADLGRVQRARPRLARVARADQHHVGVGGAVAELQPAGDPGVDSRIDVDADRRAGLGEVQPQIVALLRAPGAEALRACRAHARRGCSTAAPATAS